MKKILMFLVVAAFTVGLVACGGGGGGLNNAQSVTGTITSASGDPVPGTTVYIPGTTVTASTKAKATRTYAKVVTASDGTECEDPPAADSSLAAGCTAQDGTYTIDTSGITTNPTQLVAQRGALRMILDLNCTADPCPMSYPFGSGSTTWPTIAVVTGFWDRMEDVLAKLADTDTTDGTNGSYGRVSTTSGQFVYGSEYGTNLTIIDGTGGTTPTENATEIGAYKTWDTYLNGTNSLSTFDIVFINCGNAYEASLIANIAVLQAYVNAGGRIYVTDLSYDFVEQPFPQFMQFENDPADPLTPGALGAAEVGTGGVNLNAAVNETSMSTWLGTARVNAHDATTPGNPDNDCTWTQDPYTQVTGALIGGLIPIGDFLGGWAQMVGAHTGYTPTIWISSGAGVNFDGRANRPLTASMTQGSNGGGIIYSSYHTAHSCPTLTFWPQERVLQYLMVSAF
ncbi:MAG: hypothetical protein ABH871_07205 [Pseudomonadota bacterium]